MAASVIALGEGVERRAACGSLISRDGGLPDGSRKALRRADYSNVLA
jgi:hypothetical protein